MYRYGHPAHHVAMLLAITGVLAFTFALPSNIPVMIAAMIAVVIAAVILLHWKQSS